MKQRERFSLPEVVKNIRTKINGEPVITQVVGTAREELVGKILDSMKRAGTIHDYLKTGKLSFADVANGIDFYVVVRGEGALRTFKIDVAGPNASVARRQRQQRSQVVSVDLSLTRTAVEESITAQLLSIIGKR